MPMGRPIGSQSREIEKTCECGTVYKCRHKGKKRCPKCQHEYSNRKSEEWRMRNPNYAMDYIRNLSNEMKERRKRMLKAYYMGIAFVD